MKIKRITGKISKVVILSKTVKEVWIVPSEPLDFIAGSFINLFININGERVRRAFSISSNADIQDIFSITIRLSPNGTISKLFWDMDMTGEELEIMGPLGLNTVDKMTRKKIYLFAFGVGVGVVKSIADYFSNKSEILSLVIMTGSKYEEEILYRKYFEELIENPKLTVKHVVSRSEQKDGILSGYIQEHIEEFDFNNSSIYTCGQEEACADLIEKIKSKEPANCEFFIEGFHK